MKLKKLLALSLCILILGSSFIACKKKNENPEETTTATTVVDDGSPKLEVPRGDYGGRTFTILSMESAEYEFVADSQDNNVEAAIHNRNLTVEEYFNIKFGVTSKQCDWSTRSSYNQIITANAMAGDSDYDLITSASVYTLPISIGGYFINVNNCSDINLNAPWWQQGMGSSLAISGKLYGVHGDACLSLYKWLTVMFFNETMMADYNIDVDLYDLVSAGNWTNEEMIKLAKMMTEDLNGDGVMNYDDRYGIISSYVPKRSFMTANEFNIFMIDSEGNPKVRDLDERTIQVFTVLNDFFMDSGCDLHDDANNFSLMCEEFADRQSLFMVANLYQTESLRNMQDTYGIIPLPKGTADQENYHTQIGTNTSMLFIPLNVKDVELTAKVCETLSYYTYLNVVPEYYDITLKGRYASSPQVRDMLDLIRESATTDITFVYSTCFASPFPNELCNFRSNRAKVEITSWYKTYSKSWQTVLDEYAEAFSNLEN